MDKWIIKPITKEDNIYIFFDKELNKMLEHNDINILYENVKNFVWSDEEWVKIASDIYKELDNDKVEEYFINAEDVCDCLIQIFERNAPMVLKFRFEYFCD